MWDSTDKRNEDQLIGTRQPARVVFLDRGTVVATGKHDELLADPRYAALMRAYDDGDEAA